MLRDRWPEGEQELSRLEGLAVEAITHARGIMAELSPPVLQRLGLTEALRWWSEIVEERDGLPVRVVAPPERLPLDSTLEVAVFQAVKELLQNVVKHAGATEAVVEAGVYTDGVCISVSDDGHGFDPENVNAATEGGFGLFNIQERMAHLGATVHIESAPGQGTQVELRVPRAKPNPPQAEV